MITRDVPAFTREGSGECERRCLSELRALDTFEEAVARSSWCLVFASAALTACGPSETTIDVENSPEPLFQGTVDDATANSCSTGAVLGLSNQIVEQVNCLRPSTLAEIPARPNLTRGANAFAFMQPPARDALVRALDGNTGMTMGINSMLRTVVQQYLLYSWYMAGRCSIMLAASPGGSNHESGLALDTSQYTAWQSALEAQGFKWFGSSDVVHYDYTGSGTVDLRPIGVRGFQRLWNVNRPADVIVEDGIYGPATEARLRQSPADGFATPAPCATPPDAGPVDARSPDVADTGNGPPDAGRTDTGALDARSDGPPGTGGGGAGGSGSMDAQVDVPRDAPSSTDVVGGGTGGTAMTDATRPDGSSSTEPDGGPGDASSMPPGALDPGCGCRLAAAKSHPSSSWRAAWWGAWSVASLGLTRRRRKPRGDVTPYSHAARR